MLSAGIKARNTKFKKMTPEQKRIAIAKDVLRQLDAKVYKATRGTYIDINNQYLFDSNDSFQEKIVSKEAKCNVCAKGALFCSMVAFKNEVDIYQASWVINDKIVKRLKGIFTKSQLNLMEAYFERHIIRGLEDRKYIHLGADEALRYIMKNLIKNKGIFKP